MNVRNTSLSPVYSAPIPKTGPAKSQKPDRMNDSAKNCRDVLIVGEKCSRAHFRGVRALRACSRLKTSPTIGILINFLPPNMRLMTT